METVLLIVLGGVGVYVILDAIVFVPAVHYGVKWRFGGQIAGTLKEGFNIKIPFIDKVKIAPLDLKTKEITVKFTTKDKLRLIIPGSLQFKADKDVKDDDNRNVFVRISDEAIATGVEKDVQAKLGGIGGKYNGDQFIENRQALADLINSILRLDKPLHLHHNPRKNPEDPKNADWCGLENCPFEEGKIEAEKLIDFYNKHWKKVKGLIDGEKNRREERTEIEKRYGIDIEIYSLAQTDFTPETQAAQEEQKQAGYRAEAGRKTLALAILTKRKLRDIADQQALNWADATLNPGTPRKMISVEGEAGVMGGLLGLLSKKGKKD